MPVKTAWDNPQKDIIRIDVTAPWTWQDYDNCTLQLREMLLSVEHRVDFVADMTESGRVPDSTNSTQHVKRGRDVRPDNYGITVNVGANTVAKATFNAGTVLSPRNRQTIFFVDTIDEAYELIKKDRQRHNGTEDM